MPETPPPSSPLSATELLYEQRALLREILATQHQLLKIEKAKRRERYASWVITVLRWAVVLLIGYGVLTGAQRFFLSLTSSEAWGSRLSSVGSSTLESVTGAMQSGSNSVTKLLNGVLKNGLQ